jgi:hypothetical protein
VAASTSLALDAPAVADRCTRVLAVVGPRVAYAVKVQAIALAASETAPGLSLGSRWLTARQAAAALGITPDGVRWLLRRGLLTGHAMSPAGRGQAFTRRREGRNNPSDKRNAGDDHAFDRLIALPPARARSANGRPRRSPPGPAAMRCLNRSACRPPLPWGIAVTPAQPPQRSCERHTGTGPGKPRPHVMRGRCPTQRPPIHPRWAFVGAAPLLRDRPVGRPGRLAVVFRGRGRLAGSFGLDLGGAPDLEPRRDGRPLYPWRLPALCQPACSGRPAFVIFTYPKCQVRQGDSRSHLARLAPGLGRSRQVLVTVADQSRSVAVQRVTVRAKRLSFGAGRAAVSLEPARLLESA